MKTSTCFSILVLAAATCSVQAQRGTLVFRRPTTRHPRCRGCGSIPIINRRTGLDPGADTTWAGVCL